MFKVRGIFHFVPTIVFRASNFIFSDLFWLGFVNSALIFFFAFFAALRETCLSLPTACAVGYYCFAPNGAWLVQANHFRLATIYPAHKKQYCVKQ